MGSSPPRGVFTSSPQNCSPGYNVSHYHCCHENRCKEDIGGDGIKMIMCLTNLSQLGVDAAKAGGKTKSALIRVEMTNIMMVVGGGSHVNGVNGDWMKTGAASEVGCTGVVRHIYGH